MNARKIIPNSEIKNILISRTDNLGDVILTLPLVNETRRIFPRAAVFFLAKKYTQDLIKDYPGINEVIVRDNFGGFADLKKYLSKKNIDLAISVRPEPDLALMFYLLKIKYRIGTAYRYYSFLFNLKVHEHRKHSDKHESEYNLNLLKTYFDEVRYDKKIFLKPSPDECESFKQNFPDLTSQKYIVIHPGSRSSAKDLPAEKIAAIAENLLSDYSDFLIVLTGTQDERNVVSYIKDNINLQYNRRVIDLCGKLNLRELTVLIDNTALFISNSTGPIHIAGALDKNIIGFYPNEKVMGDIRWKPLGNNVHIIKPPGGSLDMADISVDTVTEAAEKILRNSGN